MSGSCLMNTVWRNLPSDVLDKILAFLPIASLCRFRVVSKEWNRRICHRDFALLHAQSSSPEEYVLATKRFDGAPIPHWDWKVLDVANKTSFTVSDDFIFEFVKQEGLSYCTNKREALFLKPGSSGFEEPVAHCLEPGSLRFLWREFLAIDGGLWCLFYCFSHDVERSSCGHFAHTGVFVCNPVLRTIKQLPPFTGWCRRFLRRSPRVVMSTDTFSMEYELIFFNVTDDKFLPNAIHIYELKTTSWRPCFVVPAHLNCSSRYSKACPISPVIKDEFYSFYLKSDDLTRARLASYNKVTGAIVELGLVILGNIDDYLSGFQLVVIDARLFCIHLRFGINPELRWSSIHVSEYSLSRKKFANAFVLDGDMVDWILGYDGGDTKYGQDYMRYIQAPVVATGLANSILLCSFLGRALEFSLSDGSWYKCNFSIPQDDRSIGQFLERFGSNRCLSLCAV